MYMMPQKTATIAVPLLYLTAKLAYAQPTLLPGRIPNQPKWLGRKSSNYRFFVCVQNVSEKQWKDAILTRLWDRGRPYSHRAAKDSSASRSDTWPVFKYYDMEHLLRLAMPTGGIGTGSVSLGGQGDLRD